MSNIELWQQKLGLLPVPMFGGQVEENHFVLLNGSRGNFCLDLANEPLSTESRNRAWSSNVGHYVALFNQYIEVQSWAQSTSSINRYSIESVYNNLEQFHNYLVKDEPQSSVSVIAHVIRVFRSLRAVLGQGIEGTTALKAFLYLLASATENKSRGRLAYKKWGLDAEALNAAQIVPSSQWQALKDDLIGERPVEGLTPILTLILRHAAGQVFQEAHYEAIFASPQQMLLAGFIPKPVSVEKPSKDIGLHFTPPALARTLVEEALATAEELPENSLTLFDPACGSGEFLRETLRQLILKGYKGTINLIGWDISLSACDMAKFVLAWEMRGYENQVAVQIECTDSLNRDNWPKEVDIVLMNPPFVSWGGMDAEQRSGVEKSLGKLLTEQPDMSSAFLWKAALCLRKGGVIGSILPASFLNGSATERLRGELSQELSTKLVARLGSHLLFTNAMIDAALYLARADEEHKPPIAFWADYRSTSSAAGLRALRKIRYAAERVDYPIVEEGYSIYLAPELGEHSGSWAPRPYKSWKLLHSLKHLPRVRDIFDIKKGAQTGHNKTFIISKERWETLPKSERQFFRPAVINKSIRFGFLMDLAYVFYPYGENAIETEVELKRQVKTYYGNILIKNKEVLLKRCRVNPEQWWKLHLHRAWLLEKTPKIVSTFFGDAGSFAWDDTGAYVVLQGNGWLFNPTEDFTEMPTNVWLAYLAVLNSPVFSELLSATCNHVGGGQWDLSKRFVEKIPLPNLLSDELNPSTLAELSGIGKGIHDGLPIDEEKLKELTTIIYQPSEDHIL